MLRIFHHIFGLEEALVIHDPLDSPPMLSGKRPPPHALPSHAAAAPGVALRSPDGTGAKCLRQIRQHLEIFNLLVVVHRVTLGMRADIELLPSVFKHYENCRVLTIQRF